MKRSKSLRIALAALGCLIVLVLILLPGAVKEESWLADQTEQNTSGIMIDGSDRALIWERQYDQDDYYTMHNKRVVNQEMEVLFADTRKALENSELADVIQIQAIEWDDGGGSEYNTGSMNPASLNIAEENFNLEYIFEKNDNAVNVDQGSYIYDATLTGTTVTYVGPEQIVAQETDRFNYSGIGYCIYLDNVIFGSQSQEYTGEEYDLLWEKYYSWDDCAHTDAGDWSHVEFVPINEFAYLMQCTEDGAMPHGGDNGILMLSQTSLPEELEAAGFTGIRQWMEEVENCEELRSYYRRETSGVYSRNMAEMYQKGVRFRYEQNRFVITFLDTNAMYREEFHDDLTDNLEDGWTVYNSSVGGKVDYLELRGVDVYTSMEPHFRKCIIHYQNGKIRQLELRVAKSLNSELKDQVPYIDETEINTIVNFMMDMGISKEQSEELIGYINADKETEGVMGDFEYKITGDYRNGRLLITTR